MLLSDPQAIHSISDFLGTEAREAPFDVRGAPVYQLKIPSQELGNDILLTIWPSQSRVDVRVGKSYWVLRDISDVELYPDVEVLFRRNDPPAFLFVSVQGRVAMVT